MAKSLKERVSESRRLYQNPYAHIEYLEQFAAEAASAAEAVEAAPDLISADRIRLQNQYAHLNERGGYSATARSGGYTQETDRRPKRGYSKEDIEALVRDLHADLWRNRVAYWDGAAPSDPIDVLDPAVALRVRGFDYSLADGLGHYAGSDGAVEVAGLVDYGSKSVQVSRQFPPDVQRFTAAHELGHALLHQGATGLHREKPLGGSNTSREPTELEADWFATCFLMPKKLVMSRFVDIFLVYPFELTDDTAFAIATESLSTLRARLKTRRDLSRLLASTDRYNGHFVVPLAQQFGVSVEAMAIRIEELGLVAA